MQTPRKKLVRSDLWREDMERITTIHSNISLENQNGWRIETKGSQRDQQRRGGACSLKIKPPPVDLADLKPQNKLVRNRSREDLKFSLSPPKSTCNNRWKTRKKLNINDQTRLRLCGSSRSRWTEKKI